jgi:outer membrane protein assembly factor BamB
MPVNVLTNRYNNARTGANLAETALNPQTVKVGDFGLLFSHKVDGQLYAHPLVVAGLDLPGHPNRNVVFAATSNNKVYCFDAEDANVLDPYWKADLGLPVPHGDYGGGYKDFTENIGITSTPVIDLGSLTLWVVAKTKQAGPPVQYAYHLHALDLTTGKDSRAPTLIEAQFQFTPPGGGAPKVVKFETFRQLNRPGLLLANGKLFLAFGSHGDQQPYHGWVLAYDALTLQQVGVYCNTPDTGEGGIWQSGTGLAADDNGFIYAVAGNGTIGLHPFSSRPDFGCNVVKLQATDGLRVVDWFVPSDAIMLNTFDDDLCSGPMLLPGTELLLATGKDGNFYLLDRNNLGKHVPPPAKDPQIHQLVRKAARYHIHGTPVVWDGPGGRLVYVWSEQDALQAYRFAGGLFQTPAVAHSTMSLTPDEHHMPGGILTVSADGDRGGVLWAAHPLCGDANHGTVSGLLRAFDAADVSTELWNSEMDASHRDRVGNLAKFAAPVVANGKVYLGTFSDWLRVYGLRGAGAMPPPPAGGSRWEQRDIGPSVFGEAGISCAKFTVSGGGWDIWDPSDGFHFVYRTFTGDGQIIARVSTMDAKSHWAKSGVMFRESLEPTSRHALMALTIGNGAAFQRRVQTGGPSSHTPRNGVRAPFWVRLVRQGNTLTGFVSADGQNWGAPVGSANVPMPAAVLVGLAVTSHTSDQFTNFPLNTIHDDCERNDTVFTNVGIST